MQFRLINDSPQTTYVLVLEIGADPDGEMVLIVSAGSGRADQLLLVTIPRGGNPRPPYRLSPRPRHPGGVSQASVRNACQRFSRRRRTSPPSLD